MSATDTAIRVVDWAIRGAGAPPRGDLLGAGALAELRPELCLALGRLTALTAARLRLGSPPLGDRGAVSASAGVLAAAVGAADPAAARRLLDVLEEPEEPLDWIAAHGLVAPALRFAGAELADELRLAAPLTAVLERPMPELDGSAWTVVYRLLDDAHGRRCLTLHLARPSGDPEVRRWRSSLLGRLSRRRADFVLDVYEAMMVHHRDAVLDQVRGARRVLLGGAAEASAVGAALTVAAMWRALDALDSERRQELRRRRFLEDYREGLELFRTARGWQP